MVQGAIGVITIIYETFRVSFAVGYYPFFIVVRLLCKQMPHYALAFLRLIARCVQLQFSKNPGQIIAANLFAIVAKIIIFHIVEFGHV